MPVLRRLTVGCSLPAAPCSRDGHGTGTGASPAKVLGEKPISTSDVAVNTGETVALEVDPPTTKAGSFPGNDQDRRNDGEFEGIEPILGGPPVTDGRVWQPEDTDHPTGPFVIGKRARVLDSASTVA